MCICTIVNKIVQTTALGFGEREREIERGERKGKKEKRREREI